MKHTGVVIKQIIRLTETQCNLNDYALHVLWRSAFDTTPHAINDKLVFLFMAGAHTFRNTWEWPLKTPLTEPEPCDMKYFLVTLAIEAGFLARRPAPLMTNSCFCIMMAVQMFENKAW